MNKFLVALATLTATSLQALSLFGNCAGPWATGLQFGGGGTFGSLNFHVTDSTSDGDTLNCFAYETVQQAEGGNVFIGYGFSWCERFRFTPQFDAYFLGSSARHCYAQFTIEDNYLSRVRSSTLLDLSIRPGITLGNCVLLEMKAGVSWAHMRQRLRWVNDDAPFQVQDEMNRSKWPFGYVVGATARVGLTQRLTGFIAYDWHSYRSGPTTRTFDGPAGDDRIRSSVRSLMANTFSFGLSTSF